MVKMIGKKIGMSRIYDESGVVVPVTLVKVYDGCVSSVKNCDDYNLVTISYGKDEKTEKRLSKPVLGFYKKNNLEAYDNMKTFKMDTDVEFVLGSILGIDQFNKGDFVDVSGVSKGKGFAGGMKRWGFGGLEAAHGVSISHRSIGGTGFRRREGRVAKGKHMPGHLGNERVTVKNLEIISVEADDNLICVKGAIPGSKGSDVIIKTSNL